MPRSLPLLAAVLSASLLTACEVSVKTETDSGDLQAGDAVTESSGEYDFTLTDLDGNSHDLSDYLADGKTVVLEWFNPDCPFVKKYHAAGESSAMRAFHAEVAADDLVWLAINSGAPGKQGAGADRNRTAQSEYAVDYPILLDESGEVGRMFAAQKTPHMFVLTPDDGLIYQGAIDDSDGRANVGASYVTKALEEYRAGKPITAPETKAFGCTVKYAN